MRLNRVLLLAAAINILIFALAFTSCSGEDGKNGRAADSCLVSQKVDSDDEVSYDVLCGGVYVGTLHSGNGPQGAPGNPGANGKDGQNCWLQAQGSSFNVLCGDPANNPTPSGNLDNCSVRWITDKESVLKCPGDTLGLSICAGVAFDPAKKFCNSGGTLSSGTTLDTCAGKTFNTRTHYCGYTKEDTAATATHILPLCNGNIALTPNKTGWNEQYCRFKSAKSAEVSTEYCNSKTLNEDGWKTEYCGYKSDTTTFKEPVAGICDTTNVERGGVKLFGPNQEAFGQGYCRGAKGSSKTEYTEELCGANGTFANGKWTPNNRPNDGGWKNEYCGQAKDAPEDVLTKVYGDLCDDYAVGDKEKEKYPNKPYGNGYCAVLKIDSASKKTTFLGASNFCGENPEKAPNKGGYRSEYCGFGPTSTEAADQLLSPLCGDGKGINETAYNPAEYCRYNSDNTTVWANEEAACENGDQPNKGSWKQEYCGHASDGVPTSALKGACDDGQGPHQEDFNAGYCRVLAILSADGKVVVNPPDASGKPVKTSYSDKYCETSKIVAGDVVSTPLKINENRWLGQYCAKKGDGTGDSLYTGACDDTRGPFSEGAIGYTTPPSTAKQYAPNGFCKKDSYSNNYTVYSNTWCGKFPDRKPVLLGEHCPDGNRVFTCSEGRVPVTNVYGTTLTSTISDSLCVLPAILGTCVKSGGTYNYRESAKNSRCEQQLSSASSDNCPSSASGGTDATLWAKCNIATAGGTYDRSSSSSWGWDASSSSSAYTVYNTSACSGYTYKKTGFPDVGFEWLYSSSSATGISADGCYSKDFISENDCKGITTSYGSSSSAVKEAVLVGPAWCRFKPSLAQ